MHIPARLYLVMKQTLRLHLQQRLQTFELRKMEKDNTGTDIFGITFRVRTRCCLQLFKEIISEINDLIVQKEVVGVSFFTSF